MAYNLAMQRRIFGYTEDGGDQSEIASTPFFDKLRAYCDRAILENKIVNNFNHMSRSPVSQLIRTGVVREAFLHAGQPRRRFDEWLDARCAGRKIVPPSLERIQSRSIRIGAGSSSFAAMDPRGRALTIYKEDSTQHFIDAMLSAEVIVLPSPEPSLTG
jgi:hypothetical protein